MFWAAYSAPTAYNRVVISELLFFRDNNQTYLRNVYCNDPRERSRLDYILSYDSLKHLVPSYHYLSAGDVMALFHIFREFQQRKIHIDLGTVRENERLAQINTCNLILIGSSRTNTLLQLLQLGQPYVLIEDGVRVVGHLQAGESVLYTDEVHRAIAIDRQKVKDLAYFRSLDRRGSDVEDWLWAERESLRQAEAESHLLHKYAVLTRMPHPNHRPGFVITMIAANHGRAAEGVVEFLTEQSELGDLFRKMTSDTSDTTGLPESFQVIFRVAVSRAQGEVEPETVEPIAWRIAETERQGKSKAAASKV
jgi:hypothetical protein